MSSSDVLEELKLDLSKAQAQKLAKGGAIQVTPEMIGSGIPLRMHKKKVKQIMRKKGRGKGARVMLSAEEIQGSGLWDLLKQGVKALNKVVPIRKIAKTAAKTILPAVAGVVGGPAASSVVSNVVDKYGDRAIDAMADVAGLGVRARGVRGGAVRKTKRPRGQISPPSDRTQDSGQPKYSGAKYPVSSSGSNFMSSNSAAMNPPADSVMPSGDFGYMFRVPASRRGGSGIVPAGARRM